MGLRAQTLKAEIRDLENLRHKLEERESLIKASYRKMSEFLIQLNLFFYRAFVGYECYVEKQARRAERDERA